MVVTIPFHIFVEIRMNPEEVVKVVQELADTLHRIASALEKLIEVERHEEAQDKQS